jgi:hypothetical protein
MNTEAYGAVDRVIARLVTELKPYVGDQHARYAQTTVPGGDEADIVDVLVQTDKSTSMFALWYGEGLPKSCDDSGFAEVATCTRVPDGTIVARYEEVRADEDEEPYELVRILAAFRPDGLVVTLNRYAEAGPSTPVEPWTFDSLQAIAVDSAWRA